MGERKMTTKSKVLLVCCGFIAIFCADAQHDFNEVQVPEGAVSAQAEAQAPVQALYGKAAKILKSWSKKAKGKAAMPSKHPRFWTSANGERKVRSPGYTRQDSSIGRGYYRLGSGRRRIGAGFGRRRRTLSP